MKTRKLGLDGPDVSAIGLGCMSFAGFFGTTDKAESFECLDAARDQGITFLDTAELYGKGYSEEIIGEYQQERGHRFSIATKGGIVAGGKRGENDNSESALRKALEGSLKRLRVEHVELYYIHRRDWSIKIGGFGFSEIAPSSLRRAHAVHPVTAVQNEYSLWTRYPELGMLQACAELGVAFVPFSPLARAMLTDTFPDPTGFPDTDFRKNMPRFLEPNFSANCKMISGFRNFARSRGWSTTEAALAWILDQEEHLIPIPGTRSAAHLKEWAGADEIKLTDEDRTEIERILPVGFAHGGIERYC